MTSKVLDIKSCERFYKLRDALADYAYENLDIEEGLYFGRGKKFSSNNVYNEETLAETLDEIWGSPAILDRFIKRNPASLGTEDLAVVKSWHNSLPGWFVIFNHNNRLLFLRGAALFEVTGLWDKIENVLGRSDYPMMVETTLLPFEGKIVYHGFMRSMPVSIGKGMRGMIESEIKDALRESKIITGSDEFIKAASEIKAKEAKENAERSKWEADLAAEGRKQMEGYHKGILSGLTEEEREETVSAEMKKGMSDDIRQYIVDSLKSNVTKGPVTRDLKELLSKETKDILQRWAVILGTEVAGKGTKADLICALIPELKTNPFLAELTLRIGLSLNQFDAYRRLYEAGGEFEIAEDEIQTLSGVPAASRLTCYSFYTKGTKRRSGKFTFVIPSDIMELLSGLDWDDMRRHIFSYKAAADVAEAVAELRGVAKVDEAYEEFCRFYPAALDRRGFEEAVTDSITDESIGCVWLAADDGEDYLLHYEVAGFYREAAGQGNESHNKNESEDDGFIQGSIDPIGFIEEPRKDKKARPLEEDMLSSKAVFDWKLARPAVRALRAYLDEHVPNSQNDYFYADSVIEDLIDYMTLGAMNGSSSVNDWLSILEDHDYMPNEAHLKRVIDLLMNMYNSLPTWMNNGWAPNELADIKYGRKTFYNEDGSRIKVGRNDPCPCGSGKKYKNCCGRRSQESLPGPVPKIEETLW